MLRSLLGLSLVGLAAAQGSVAELTAPNGSEGSQFGQAVAMGPRHLLVGAPWTKPKYRGRAYLFDRETGEHLRTYAPEGWAEFDNLGLSVAVDGEVAVLARRSDVGGLNAGSVYVYDLETGNLRFELFSPTPADVDSFGQAIALGPAYIAVSAPGDDGAAPNAGAIFLFQRETGELLHTLRASLPRDDMQLGRTLAVHDNFVVAGALWDQGAKEDVGAVFVFDILLGQQRHRLFAPDRAAGDRFGHALAASDGRALISSPYWDGTGRQDVGKVYLVDLGTGALLREISAPDPETKGAYFGSSVALAEGVLVVGAPGSDRVVRNGGLVYLFDEQGHLLHHFGDPAEHDRYGQRLVASGERALVGVPAADPQGASSGEAHLVCLERDLGVPFCGPANLNSTGEAAEAATFGNFDLGCARFDLRVSQVPPGALCAALVAEHEDFVSLAWGGVGNLCLAQPIGLFADDVAAAGPDGLVTLALNVNAPLPPPLGEPVLSGQTWRFQVWYRDQHLNLVSNFSDGVAVTFD